MSKYFKHQEIVKKELESLLANDKVCEMKQYIQHGTITTFEHSLSVAVISHMIAKKYNLDVSIKELLTGAMLHDFFLYDWHDGRLRTEGIHGFSHPATALKNANTYFSLTDKEQNIIQSHMFPMTITKVPKCKEAAIVCIADKICATWETVNGFYKKVFFRKYLKKFTVS